MVRRGGTAFAPENSVEACAAAMDYGADGCRVEVRRTRDGILVLFSDGFLDRLTLGFGPLSELSYRELLALGPQEAFGRPLSGGVSTLTAALNLARQRAMLLDLDVKEPGLDEEVARLIDAADAWDHVVEAHSAAGAWLSGRPQFSPLPYKADLSGEHRCDTDPDSVKAALELPGRMILVDDPRVAVSCLRRDAYRPVPRLTSIHLSLVSPQPVPGETNRSVVLDHIASLERRFGSVSVSDLARFCEASGKMGDRGPQQVGAMRIIDRAWAARRLGEVGTKSTQVVKLLGDLVAHPSPDSDPNYDGLDAACAARALGELGATEAVPVLVAAFKGASPSGGGVAVRAAHPGDPYTRDSRIRTHVLAALGELRCAAAKKFLVDYVNLDDAHALAWGPPRFEDAARALLRQRIAWGETATLLRSRNLAVRATVMVECIDQITEERRMALKAAAPWALELPRHKRVSGSRTIEWH